MNVVGGPFSKVSNWIPSFVNNANFHGCVHLSHESGGVIVGFCQKASTWRVVMRESVADCAMLYSITW